PAGTATATTGGSTGVTVTAQGSGTISVATYGATGPLGWPPSSTNGAIDVHLTSGSTFTSVTVVDCDLNGGNVVYWFNGSTWTPVSPQTYDATAPSGQCAPNVTMTLSATSSPSLSQLTGTVFGASKDTTPPQVTLTLPTPPSGQAGYFNAKQAPVTGSVSATDPFGVTAISCTDSVSVGLTLGTFSSAGGSSRSVSIAGDGTHIISCSATDGPGNVGAAAGSSNTATVKIDTTPPVVQVTGVTSGATYTLGAVPTPGCSTTDATSGVAAQATVKVSGGTANGVGQFTATCSGALDNAGNPQAAPVSVSYTVYYSFSGFLAPVGNPPTVNTVHAGRTLPLKWSLHGVSALSSVVSLEWSTVSCSSLTGATSTVDATATGGTALRYDASADQFIDNLATQSSWAGTCQQLTLTLDDGTTHIAFFQFE
ncbi:MAG TPA: PxKF domain-containing protein, partial [Dehalococcoidia bacterium]|nr:PxKF domain-containing protein [Dehalococcoidia bacterium]